MCLRLICVQPSGNAWRNISLATYYRSLTADMDKTDFAVQDELGQAVNLDALRVKTKPETLSQAPPSGSKPKKDKKDKDKKQKREKKDRGSKVRFALPRATSVV